MLKVSKDFFDVSALKQLAYTYGLVRLNSDSSASPLSIVLNPKQLQEKHHQELLKAAKQYHDLLAIQYNSVDKLLKIVKDLKFEDPYLQTIISLVEQNTQKNKTDPIIIRNDFMLNQNFGGFKQIENNLAAVSMTTRAFDLTKLLNHYYLGKADVPLGLTNIAFEKQLNFLKECALREDINDGWFLTLTEDDNANGIELMKIESGLQALGVKSFTIKISEINSESWLVDSNNVLQVKGRPIAFVYSRTFYNHIYLTKDTIPFFLAAQNSLTPIMPSPTFLFVNSKQIQYICASKKLLSKYGLENIARHPFQSFMNQMMSLKIEFEGSIQKLKDGIKDPKAYIFKGFAEGGMADIVPFEELDSFLAKEPNFLDRVILVEKNMPPPEPSFFLKNGEIIEDPSTIGEFGVYSQLVLKKEENGEFQRQNEQVWDLLLRTKSAATSKGGIMVSAAGIDSFFLEYEHK